jgi:hypothetical protein
VGTRLTFLDLVVVCVVSCRLIGREVGNRRNRNCFRRSFRGDQLDWGINIYFFFLIFILKAAELSDGRVSTAGLLHL